MAGYTAIAIEGVLADVEPDDSFAASKLISAGAVLYHSLKQTTKIVLYCDEPDGEKVSYWLKAHGFRDHLDTLYSLEPVDRILGRSELIERTRRMGSLDLLIEADPALGAKALSLGVPTLLLTVPTYTRPEFYPDAERTPLPWGDLVGELDRQRELRTQDERVTADVAGTRFVD